MRRILFNRLVNTLLIIVVTITIPACTQIASPVLLGPNVSISQAINTETLTLLTLNVAHGRKDALNQMLVPGTSILNNLDEIAALLREADADVVALQEADGPSVWSGNFDHVGYLAQAAGYPWDVRSDHVKGKRLNYGTGLLSRTAFLEVISHDFPETRLTLRKGFTLGQIEWQPDENKPSITVDILSVHLDFFRNSIRKQQISSLLRILETRKRPVIILGDFNSNWLAKDSVIRHLAECGSTRVFEPHSINLGTYNSGEHLHRLDWVLLSTDLEFKRYEVLPDIVSDHQAMVVEVSYIGGKQQNKGSSNASSSQCNGSATAAGQPD